MPSPPAQLGSLKIPNQQEGIALHRAFQKPFLPSAMGRLRALTWTSLIQMGDPAPAPCGSPGGVTEAPLRILDNIASPSKNLTPREHLPFFHIFILGENSVHAASE